MKENLDWIERTFLWEVQNEKRKLHPMRWDKVIKPKRADGGGPVVMVLVLVLAIWNSRTGHY